MSIVQAPPEQQRLVLDGISWRAYTRLSRALEEGRFRITYDRGALEIMTLTHEHESYANFLGRLAVTLTEELGMPVKDGGSTTFRRRKKQRGFEPDNCYWIASEPQVRGKLKLDLKKDPPPDLAIEVDITSSWLDRMGIYAAFGVAEVWRFDGQQLEFHSLRGKKYAVVAQSQVFSGLVPSDLLSFLTLRQQMDENAVVRQFRAWVRQKFPTAGPAPSP